MSTATSDNESEPSHSPAQSTRNFESIRHDLGAIRSALAAKPPVVSGSIAVTPEQCILFYEGRDGSLGKLDFSNASPFEVEALESACERATFGRNSEDVLDETYRKAGKLDVRSFATTLQIQSLQQIVERVRSVLAEGTDPESDAEKTIVAELYKLNTYGVGGFFKAHQDTPHSEDMFGRSLVVILPIAHEGGDLVVRHAGDSWSFGFGEQLAVKDDSSTPSISYVAFYSDVEHEVLPVTSGCRVTLTFNLLWAPSKSTVPKFDPLSLGSDDDAGTTVAIDPKLERLGTALSAALANPALLPEGGTIGVHLQHRYPVGSRSSWNENTTCKKLLGKLKGSDRTLYRACLRNLFSAQVELQLYCEIPDFGQFLCGARFYLDNRDQIDDDELFEVLRSAGAVALGIEEWAEENSGENMPERMKGEIEWVNSSQSNTWTTEEFISYGNQAQMSCAYYNACLLLKVGKPGARTDREGPEAGDSD